MDIQLVKCALSYISSRDRPIWVNIGMALKSEYGEAGFEIWDEWSRTSHNYNESDAKTAWRSFDAHGGITIGTLIHEAKRHGFKTSNLKQNFGKKIALRISDRKFVAKGLSFVANSVPAMEQPLPLGFANKNDNGKKYIDLLPDVIYEYRNFNRQLSGYVYRYEVSTLQKADSKVTKKVLLPISQCSDGNWYAKGLPAYPFYGSEKINDSNGTYLIHEGEKCSDLANEAFPLITSLTTQGGADGLSKLLLEEETINALKIGRGFILRDKDASGIRYARNLKALLKTKGIAVTILSIDFIERKLNTVLEDGADIEQLIEAGLTEEILHEWMSYQNNDQDFKNCLVEQQRQDDFSSASDDDSIDNLTVKQMVNSFIEHVLSSITEAYKDKSNDDVYIKIKQHNEYFITNSSLFQEWILDNFHQQYKRICKDSKEIAKIITSRAKLKATPFEKISRITFSGEKHELTINVGNDRLVYISKNEVSFSENKALSFQYEHSSNHIPYDYCEESSTLDEVRAFFGVNDFDLLKILAHIAISYLETEHKALLNIYGPKGVGKSTLARKIMSVANPSKSINTFPYRRNDFCEIAHKGGMLTFDNLSKIDKTMSDLMATTITGSEEEVRKHFRQNQTIKYVLFSSITITSIDNCVTESDLNDRSFAIHLFEREYLFKDFPPPKLGKVVNFIFQMLSKILLLKEHGRFISDSRQNRKNSWLELVANAVGIDFSDYQGEECRQNVENEVKSILQDVVAVAILDKLNNSNGAIEGYVSDFYRNLHSERVGSLYYVQNQELARIGIREFCKRIRNINFKLIGVQVDGPARRKTRDRRGEYVQIFWMKEDVQKATVTNISHYKENRISQKFQEAVELIVDKLGLNNSNDKNGMIRTSIKSAVCGIDAEIIVDTFSIIHLTEEEQLVYRNPVKLHELIKNRGVR